MRKNAEMPEDDELLGLAVKGIEQLNARHGNGSFILFHRPRTWCETERPLDRMGDGNAENWRNSTVF